MSASATSVAHSEPPDDLAGAALTLARCFAAGATMWCVAPQWPEHGRHVAVEFVHPVIVGKRALPAIGVEEPDPVSNLRLLARPDDVVLLIASADAPGAGDLLRRAEAWGLTRLWLGAGPRPSRCDADHLIWVDDVPAAVAARSGDIVLFYHLLWELTHLALEHPGLLRPPAGPRCITCSDAAPVGEIQVVGDDGSGEVIVGGRRQHVDLSLLPRVVPGDLVLVHAGVALAAPAPGGIEGWGGSEDCGP